MTDAVLPAVEAVPAAATAWIDVTKNEETRFNNLNTRALGVLTISALVTSLAGFFAKDLTSTTGLTGGPRVFAAWALAGAVILVATAAGVAIIGVLRPKRRVVFGDNELENHPEMMATAPDVSRVLYQEYRAIAIALRERNADKADKLVLSYYFVGAAVVIVSSAAVVVAVSAALK